MRKNIYVLYVGSLDIHCNSYRRYENLRQICTVADAVNTDTFLKIKFFAGIQYHFNKGPGVFKLNLKIRKLAKEKKYDAIIIDNKPYLSAKTLTSIKLLNNQTRIVNILTDDPFGMYSKAWTLLKKTVKHYDIFFVQRKQNIDELKNLRAKQVEICYRSFDPAYNRPLELTANDKMLYECKVGFIGTYEKHRASFIAYLIQHNIPVSVTGNDFEDAEYWDIIKPHYKGKSIYGEEYIKAINGMGIALHFLRRANRDEQDSRTFEIPACRVFMLAERSSVHQELFKEDEEAVFFESKEELLSKVHFYLNNELERQRIALNGYNRSFNSGYTHKDRMQKIINTISAEPIN